jgi:glycerol uptake facilitator-like aquaporin
MKAQRIGAEALGTGLLLATVIGSGIMGERLADGNVALALLGNTLATGAMLVVLITMFGPISGAHFNPSVTAGYVAAQIGGGIVGVVIAHAMFDESALQLATKMRSGPGQWLSEAVAAFGLVLTILLTLRANSSAVATSVGLYITAAYWFTASTSFANPAVTIARAFSDTFAGIRLADAGPFIVAQLLGAVVAMLVCRTLLPCQPPDGQ